MILENRDLIIAASIALSLCALGWWLAARLALHPLRCNDSVTRRQLYQLVMVGLAVIAPAFVVGIYARSEVLGFLIVGITILPLWGVYRYYDGKYRQWKSDEEFKRLLDFEELPLTTRPIKN